MARGAGMSSIKEVLAGWGDVARLLRGGESGSIVPVVIPKDSRGLRWLTLVWFAVWAALSGFMLRSEGYDALGTLAVVVAVLSLVLAGLWWWRSSIVEIEERSEEHTSELQSRENLVC